MARIALKDLVKTFGAYTAVSGINLDIRDGEFLIMVGPSGCGKTTTLNMISGLETPTSGEIVIGNTVVNDLEPGERGLGMVFQDLALFPHMTVFENIAFGLRVREGAGREIAERVTAAAEAVHIKPLLAKLPRHCSGGESQRVALARTIVTNPAVFLMDEPLSSLDAKLRVDMRTELKGLHERLKRDLRLRHARPGRGHDHGRPHRRHEQGQHRAARHAARDLQPPGNPLRRRLLRHADHEFRGRRGRAQSRPAPASAAPGIEQPLPVRSLSGSLAGRRSCSACARSMSLIDGGFAHRHGRAYSSRSATRRSCISTPGRARRWSPRWHPTPICRPARRSSSASPRSIAICSTRRAASA